MIQNALENSGKKSEKTCLNQEFVCEYLDLPPQPKNKKQKTNQPNNNKKTNQPNNKKKNKKGNKKKGK